VIYIDDDGSKADFDFLKRAARIVQSFCHVFARVVLIRLKRAKPNHQNFQRVAGTGGGKKKKKKAQGNPVRALQHHRRRGKFEFELLGR
jgi:hypothetical protein